MITTAYARATARAWLTDNPLFVDAEATGYGADGQVIEIAVYDAAGDEVLHSYLCPTVDIDPTVQFIHEIAIADLVWAPSWPTIEDRLCQVLAGRTLVAFDADQVIRLLAQTAKSFGRSADWIQALDRRCAKELALAAIGPTTGETITLSGACQAAEVEMVGYDHSARSDAMNTLGLVEAIAE
jgi:DNA polymerase III epsilon subunit-like protein